MNFTTIEIKGLKDRLAVFVHSPRTIHALYFTDSIPTLVKDMQALFGIDPKETLGLLFWKKPYIETELRRLEKHLKLGDLTIDEYIANTIDAIDRAAAKAIEDSYEEVPPIGPDPEVIMSFPSSP